MRLRAAALGISLVLLAASGPALAQPDDATRLAARTLGEAGLALLESGNYAGALEKFDRALALVEVPTLGVRAARCLVRLGRLVEASERYRQVGAMVIDPGAPAAFRQAQLDAQTEAEAERAEVIKRLPTLEIALAGAVPAEVSLTIDGKPVPSATIGLPRPMDPGPHRLLARRDPDVAGQDVLLSEGQPARVVLAFPLRAAPVPGPIAPPPGPGPIAPPPGPPPAPLATGDRPGATQRVVGFAAMGVGAAGVLVWGVTYGLALGKKSELDGLCPNQACRPDAKGTLDGYDRLRTVSTVSLVGGGVLLAGGLVAVLSAPDGRGRRAAVTPWIGPGGGGVRGTF